MCSKTITARLAILPYLIAVIACSVLAASTSSATDYFSNADISRLQTYCRDNSGLRTSGRKKLLLYHRSGYIPSVHFQLPEKIRADSLDSAAAVLCLEDAPEVIETCKFSIFLSVERVRQRYRVDALSPDSNSNRLAGLNINGPAPKKCNELGALDSTVTAVMGDAISVDNVLDFISANGLDREDNDRDGLRNLEEFKLGTDANDAASPSASAAVRVNNSISSQIFAGETAEIRIDLWPGPYIGNVADYYFWADTPDGRVVLQFPAGLVPMTNMLPALEDTPLVSLFNFRLFRLKDLAVGEYTFHFEARDALGSIEKGSASLKVVKDPCRETVRLPISITGDWDANCTATADTEDGYLARYYTFTLSQQSGLMLALAGETAAEIILREGSGRGGSILRRSSIDEDTLVLGLTLPAGTYTAEVMLKSPTPSSHNFELASSQEVIPWQFKDVTALAGINHVHGYKDGDFDTSDPSYERILQGGGVAGADYDLDGWPDLYVTAGSAGANLLYRNRGDGTFVDMAATAGVAFTGRKDAGASFADMDGDGWPDLFLGGVNGTPPLVLRNRQDGTFEDVTEASGLADISNAYSASFADFDKDGDLDAYISHWNDSLQGRYLFTNDGKGVFTDVSAKAGIPDGLMADYTPIFADIDNDGWLDLLVAADYNSSQVFINNRNGTFRLATDINVITDENGMGASAADFDNDGDIDWFVTSIFDPSGLPDNDLTAGAAEATGNRLYRNKGDGTFEDVTETAGVRLGSWGWGSCFADFNNDGHLDLFHVNGYVTGNFNTSSAFLTDESLMFISNGDGTFDGFRQDLRLSDRGQGRGLVCFDYDLDGDIDIFVANNQQAPSLYRNDGGNDLNFIHVRLGGEALNSEGIGGRVSIVTGNLSQIREIQAGNNFISSNPAEAYFGVGSAKVIDEVRITWPSGEEKVFSKVKANQMLTIFK